MPIMLELCATCPFREDRDGVNEVRTGVTQRVLTEGSQTCHSTGLATWNSVGRDSASLLAELKRRITADVQLPYGVYAAIPVNRASVSGRTDTTAAKASSASSA